jgi:hypothetical protein
MKLIRPNCRLQFTPADLDFVVSVLHPPVADPSALQRLLGDEEARDLILDDEALVHAVLEQSGCLRVSAHFYFYILVRHACRRFGITDRSVADYVAALLVEFARAEAEVLNTRAGPAEANSVAEVLAQLSGADDVTRFLVRTHLANVCLVRVGLFPDRVRHRTERRGAPGLRYYEGIGQSCYREASGHRLARRYQLESIYESLADHFQETRLALNDLGERLVSLGDGDAGSALDALVRPPAGLWQ